MLLIKLLNVILDPKSKRYAGKIKISGLVFQNDYLFEHLAIHLGAVRVSRSCIIDILNISLDSIDLSFYQGILILTCSKLF